MSRGSSNLDHELICHSTLIYVPLLASTINISHHGSPLSSKNLSMNFSTVQFQDAVCCFQLSWNCTVLKSIDRFFLKVRWFRNGFWCLLFPPKNEQKNFTLLLWYLKLTCFRSFFGGNIRHQKTISKLSDL